MTRRRRWIACCALLAAGVIGSGLGVMLHERAAQTGPPEAHAVAPASRPEGGEPRDLRDEASAPVESRAPGPLALDPGESDGQATLVVRVSNAQGVTVRVQVVPRDIDKKRHPQLNRCAADQHGVVASAVTQGASPSSMRVPAETSLVLFASAAGEATPRVYDHILPLGRGERRQVEVVLPSQPAFFHGLVVAQESGRPIGGARIQALEELADCLSATSEADGTFRLEVGAAPVSAQRIGVRAPGLAGVRFYLDREHTDPYRPRRVELPATGSLAVRVRRPDRSPVPGVEVRVSAFVEAQTDMALEQRATTGDDGTCEIADVAHAATLAVDLHRNGRVLLKGPRVRGLGRGERRKLDVELDVGARLLGRLVDQSGAPLPGVSVGISPGHRGRGEPFLSARAHPIAQRALTAPDGSFVFTDVAPGRWKIGPLVAKDDPTNLLAGYAQPVDVPAGASEVPATVVAYNGLFITGRILQADGQPAEGIGVFTEPDADLLTFSDAEGRFRLGPAWPEEFEVASDPPSTPVTVQPGSAPVTLRLLPGGAVSGIIVDARSGQQLEGEVRLRSLTSDRASDTSSIAGIFSFRGLPPDRYDITARTPDGLVGSVRDVKIDVGARERLRIEVDTGAVLDLVAVETDTTLRVVDLAGRTVCEFFAEFAGSTFSCVLEPGSCIVRRERNEKVLDEVKLTLRRGERRKLAPGEATD